MLRRSFLEGFARGKQTDAAPASYCQADAAGSGMQQPLRLPRRSLAVFNQRHIRAHQLLQIPANEWVVRASQHQRVDLPGLSVKKAHSPRMMCADSYYFCSVCKAGTGFDGACQAVAGLPARAASSAWNRALVKVLRVAITPMRPVLLSATAGFTAGSTPMIGRLGYSVRSQSMAAAVAVLQVTTSAMTFCPTSSALKDRTGCG